MSLEKENLIKPSRAFTSTDNIKLNTPKKKEFKEIINKNNEIPVHNNSNSQLNNLNSSKNLNITKKYSMESDDENEDKAESINNNFLADINSDVEHVNIK